MANKSHAVTKVVFPINSKVKKTIRLQKRNKVKVKVKGTREKIAKKLTKIMLKDLWIDCARSIYFTGISEKNQLNNIKLYDQVRRKTGTKTVFKGRPSTVARCVFNYFTKHSWIKPVEMNRFINILTADKSLELARTQDGINKLLEKKTKELRKND